MTKESKRRVLIVDDEDVNLQLLSNILRAQGYEIATATNGRDAVHIIKKNPPDMVLLDVEMPVMDGYETLKKIRETYPANRLPVIIITIKDESEDMVHAFEMGANDFVIKPIDLAVLLARIRTHLSVIRDGNP